MISLSVKTRKELGKRVKKLRKKGVLPAVLYGPKVHSVESPKAGTSLEAELFNRAKSLPLEIDLREFEKVYREAGESSLISLKVEDFPDKKFLVLVHEVQRDPLTETPNHVDFYQPSLTEEVEVKVPLIFDGEAPAVKDMGGTLIKNISEVEVKALPQNLPKEIRINVGILKTFEDEILIKDLKMAEGVKVLKEPEELVALVSPPEKIEEELEKPIEEKVEEVEKVEKKKEEEEETK